MATKTETPEEEKPIDMQVESNSLPEQTIPFFTGDNAERECLVTGKNGECFKMSVKLEPCDIMPALAAAADQVGTLIPAMDPGAIGLSTKNQLYIGTVLPHLRYTSQMTLDDDGMLRPAFTAGGAGVLLVSDDEEDTGCIVEPPADFLRFFLVSSLPAGADEYPRLGGRLDAMGITMYLLLLDLKDGYTRRMTLPNIFDTANLCLGGSELADDTLNPYTDGISNTICKLSAAWAKTEWNNHLWEQRVHSGREWLQFDPETMKHSPKVSWEDWCPRTVCGDTNVDMLASTVLKNLEATYVKSDS